jgi:hypothetical protein
MICNVGNCLGKEIWDIDHDLVFARVVQIQDSYSIVKGVTEHTITVEISITEADGGYCEGPCRS